ncbi:MAG: hypothetical protein JWN62_2258 [Acidimicrobiales bacterium]|nr:hypothetical protein [Acidimicrobiales bacterium]
MTPSIDVSLPAAPSTIRQTNASSASAPVTFQDCLDGVPPADVASPVATGSPDDDQTDEPHKTAKPVDDAAAIAALAALSVLPQRAALDGGPGLLGSGAADRVAGGTTDVVDGSDVPQSAAALTLVAGTNVDPALAAELGAAAIADQVAPGSAADDTHVATAGSTGAITEATTTSQDPGMASAPQPPSVSGLEQAATEPAAMPAIDAAAAAEPAVPDPTVGAATPDELSSGRTTDALAGGMRSAARPNGAPSSAGPARPVSSSTASSTLLTATPASASASAPAAASGAGASRRGADTSKVDGAATSPAPTVVGHDPVRSSTASSTLADPSGRGTTPLAHAETVPDRATATHTGPMHLDVDLGGEGLGPLRLRATSVAGQLHVSMTATDVRVRSALLDRSLDLKRDMRSAGLDLASFDVNGSVSGRASDRDPGGRSSAAHADDAPGSAAPVAEAAGGASLRRVTGAASTSRLDLLL